MRINVGAQMSDIAVMTLRNPGNATQRLSRSGSSISAEASRVSPAITSISQHTRLGDQQFANFNHTPYEQVVNTSLIDLLIGFTVNIPGVKCEWTINCEAFTANFEHATMEARTGGYLTKILPSKRKGQQTKRKGKADQRKVDDRHDIYAIVEAKARERSRNSAEGHAIFMHESAEMVAWILRDEERRQGTNPPE